MKVVEEIIDETKGNILLKPLHFSGWKCNKSNKKKSITQIILETTIIM